MIVRADDGKDRFPNPIRRVHQLWVAFLRLNPIWNDFYHDALHRYKDGEAAAATSPPSLRVDLVRRHLAFVERQHPLLAVLHLSSPLVPAIVIARSWRVKHLHEID